GVEAYASQEEGEHGAGEGAEEDDAEQAECHGQAHEDDGFAAEACDVAGEEPDADEADGAEDGAESEAGGDLAAGDAPPVAEADLVHGHGTDDEGGGLRTGIAAARD